MTLLKEYQEGIDAYYLGKVGSENPYNMLDENAKFVSWAEGLRDECISEKNMEPISR